MLFEITRYDYGTRCFRCHKQNLVTFYFGCQLAVSDTTMADLKSVIEKVDPGHQSVLANVYVR